MPLHDPPPQQKWSDIQAIYTHAAAAITVNNILSTAKCTRFVWVARTLTTVLGSRLAVFDAVSQILLPQECQAFEGELPNRYLDQGVMKLAT